MFRKGRGTAFLTAVVISWLLASGTWAGASASPLAPTRAAETTSVTPADGWLRGPDFAAKVTEVGWPDQYVFAGKSEEPPPGHRFVVFDLSLSERTSALQGEAVQPLVTAAVRWGRSSLALTLTSVDSQITMTAPGKDWAIGTASFVATVANTTHDVSLVLTEGTFSQSFNLWSLHRNAPAPTVLYRDPSFPTLSGTSEGSTSIALSNLTDGFATTDTLSLQSSVLSAFAPSGDAVTPTSPDQAVLSVVLDGEHPNNPNDLTGSGHYLGAQSPLPGSMVTFTPNGSGPIAATLSGGGDTTGKGNADDGLFDATYSFGVPATVTAGTIGVLSGSFTGAEYTLFTPEQGTTTLHVSAPASLSLGFPAVPASTVQKKPPWVGAPPPPTASVASHGPGPSSSPGPSIWMAVLVLAIVAGLVVVAQRWYRRRTRGRTEGVPTPARDDVTLTSVERDDLPDPETSSAPVASTDTAYVADTVASLTPSILTVNVEPAMNLIGPPQVLGWRQVPDRRIVEELLAFLVLHAKRPMSADQIQVGMRPLERSRADASRGTFHSYLSMLRQSIGAEHLPEATNAGYLVVGVGCDWLTFEQLDEAADRTEGQAAIDLRQQALALIRGVPFEGLGSGQTSGQYDWAFDEQLHTHMSDAIVTCALRAANDLVAIGFYDPAERAARAGLRGAPKDPHLVNLLERIVDMRHEGLARPGQNAGDESAGRPDGSVEPSPPT